MTEPVLIKRSFLIALMVILQTIRGPLVASAALYGFASIWHISFGASAQAVIETLIFLVLLRPPLALSSQLTWRPGMIAGTVVLRWLLLMLVLSIIGYSTRTTRSYPWLALTTWYFGTPVLLIASALGVSQIMRRVILSAVSSRKVIFAGYN